MPTIKRNKMAVESENESEVNADSGEILDGEYLGGVS